MKTTATASTGVEAVAGKSDCKTPCLLAQVQDLRGDLLEGGLEVGRGRGVDVQAGGLVLIVDRTAGRIGQPAHVDRIDRRRGVQGDAIDHRDDVVDRTRTHSLGRSIPSIECGSGEIGRTEGG